MATGSPTCEGAQEHRSGGQPPDLRAGRHDLRSLLDTLWLEVHWVNYGPFGRLHRRDGLLVPLRRPAVLQPGSPPGAAASAARCCRSAPTCWACSTIRKPCCVATRSPAAARRCAHHRRNAPGGDAGALPPPRHGAPSGLARLLCRVFHPTSSLASACGLQSLIDVVGPPGALRLAGGHRPQAGGREGGLLPPCRGAGPPDRRHHRHHSPLRPDDRPRTGGSEGFCERMPPPSAWPWRWWM